MPGVDEVVVVNIRAPRTPEGAMKGIEEAARKWIDAAAKLWRQVTGLCVFLPSE